MKKIFRLILLILLLFSGIKSLDGIWEPNGSANTITHFEPGKGYLINKK